jgi:hypothetical protein
VGFSASIGTGGPDSTAMFFLDTEGHVMSDAQAQDLSRAAVFSATWSFSVAGRPWNATYYASPGFLTSRRSNSPNTILAVLILLTVSTVGGAWGPLGVGGLCWSCGV